jgi:hypothetical protein
LAVRQPALAAALLVAAACGDEAVVRPVIDTPPPGAPAYPFDDLDALELSIARAGESAPLAAKRVGRNEVPSLPTVGFGDDLVLHLSGTRGGVELAYGRSCAFAVRGGEPPPAPHLFFGRIVKWATGPAPAERGRTGGVAYTAPDGSAVFLGGEGGEVAVERFVPAEATFVTAGESAARRGSVVAPLGDGSALRVGGVIDDAQGPVAFFELVSPLRGAIDTVADEQLRLVDHAAATLVDGSVVVIGGRAPGATGLETTGAAFALRRGDAGVPEPARRLAATLAVPRAGHTLTRLGDEVGAAVLVVGGRDAGGRAVGVAELYEPLRETFAAFRPEMVHPRSGHRAVLLPDGSVLVVGGVDGDGRPVDAIELYLPLVGLFLHAGAIPAGAGVTELTATPLPDGRVLLAGGRDRDGQAVATTTIARLDPVDGTVDLSRTDSLAVPRAGHAAALLCDGTVLLVGGSDAAGAPGSERYNPPSVGRR